MAQTSSSRTMVILALLLFAGAGIVGWLMLKEDPRPPHRPPPERPIEPQGGGLVTAPPPPLPPPPPIIEEPDAGVTKVRRTGGGGGGRCNGNVDAGAVRRYAQQHSGALRRCYERRLKQNQTLAGRMEIGMTIGAGGQVQSARVVSDSVRDPEVSSCVRQAVAQWRGLPAPQGGCVNVNYPIAFTPRASD